jgi:hypothetical protein
MTLDADIVAEAKKRGLRLSPIAEDAIKVALRGDPWKILADVKEERDMLREKCAMLTEKNREMHEALTGEAI